MPALLYGIGAFALFAGLLMIGFGIPINEFSFGNTLIRPVRPPVSGVSSSLGSALSPDSCGGSPRRWLCRYPDGPRPPEALESAVATTPGAGSGPVRIPGQACITGALLCLGREPIRTKTM